MGLETVEFVMAIEEEFSIKIPDRDEGRLETVRNLIDYIEKKAAEMRQLKNGHCLSQNAFHSFRAKALPILKPGNLVKRSKNTMASD